MQQALYRIDAQTSFNYENNILTKRTFFYVVMHMNISTMKKLKENLSQLAEEAASGLPIHVYRYNKPFIKIVTDSEDTGVHVGKNFGKGRLSSPLKVGLAGHRSLKILLEDRNQ
jgi:hypothetical protein